MTIPFVSATFLRNRRAVQRSGHIITNPLVSAIKAVKRLEWKGERTDRQRAGMEDPKCLIAKSWVSAQTEFPICQAKFRVPCCRYECPNHVHDVTQGSIYIVSNQRTIVVLGESGECFLRLFSQPTYAFCFRTRCGDSSNCILVG